MMVLIDSRYDVKEEIDLMTQVLKSLYDILPFEEYEKLNEIFCDSKATCVYTIEFNTMPVLGTCEDISNSIIDHGIGHNGIYFECDGEVFFNADPHWPELTVIN